MGGPFVYGRTAIVFFFLLGFASLLVPSAVACTCIRKHPQQHACDADFVLTARVRRPRSTAEGLTKFKIRVKRIFKMTDKASEALSKKFVYTPGLCEVSFRRRMTYVLTGTISQVNGQGKPWVTACNFVAPWRSLTPKMKKGFKNIYETGCKCPIISCHWWDRCPHHKFFCAWDGGGMEEDCQERHGVCLQGPDNSCNWLGGRLYRRCQKKNIQSGLNNEDNFLSNEIPAPVGRKITNRRYRGRKLDLYRKQNRNNPLEVMHRLALNERYIR